MEPGRAPKAPRRMCAAGADSWGTSTPDILGLNKFHKGKQMTSNMDTGYNRQDGRENHDYRRNTGR